MLGSRCKILSVVRPAVTATGLPDNVPALTSSVALLEVPVAWAMARWQCRRERAAAAVGALLVGWVWPPAAARNAADLAGDAAGAVWQWSMRVTLPLVIALVMSRGLDWI